MAGSARRRQWLVGLIFAQCLLAWLAVYLSLMDTWRLGSRYASNMGRSSFGQDHGSYGYPVPWAEYSQSVRVPSNGPEERDPRALKWANPAIPLALGLFAVTLPPAIIGWLRRKRAASSRGVRWFWVLCPAAAVGLSSAWISAELWTYGPTPFQERLPDKWPAGQSVRQLYDEKRLAARKHALRLYTPENFVRPNDFTEPSWSTRTWWTVLPMLASGTAAGLLVFRPWRRPDSPASPSATPATTPPTS